jgi:hypothetical protein
MLHPTSVLFFPFCLSVVLLAPGRSAMAGENPEFTSVEKKETYELRRYAPTIEAQVTVSGEYRATMNASFGLLAGYIFGKNSSADGASQKIAMTAPVTAQQTARTASVSGKDGSQSWRVTFTMPRKWTMESLPQPKDRRVTLVENPGGLYVAQRFAGLIKTPEDWRVQEESLRGALVSAGLRANGPAMTAMYNGPWVPGPMRRNEVLIPVRCSDKGDARCTAAAGTR